MRHGYAAALGLTLALTAARAEAMHLAPPDNLILVGPSLAYSSIVGEADRASLGLDLTLTQSLFWVSAGARFMPGDEWVSLPYGEFGLWLGANVGFGGTLIEGGPRGNQLAPHLFVGIPFPVQFADGVQLFGGGMLVEPYYRPLWWQGNTLHEVGVLFKVFAWSSDDRPPPPPPDPDSSPLVDPSPQPQHPAPPPPAPEEPPHAPLGDAPTPHN